jgi:hypothetical protein
MARHRPTRCPDASRGWVALASGARRYPVALSACRGTDSRASEGSPGDGRRARRCDRPLALRGDPAGSAADCRARADRRADRCSCRVLGLHADACPSRAEAVAHPAMPSHKSSGKSGENVCSIGVGCGVREIWSEFSEPKNCESLFQNQIWSKTVSHVSKFEPTKNCESVSLTGLTRLIQRGLPFFLSESTRLAWCLTVAFVSLERGDGAARLGDRASDLAGAGSVAGSPCFLVFGGRHDRQSTRIR